MAVQTTARQDGQLLLRIGALCGANRASAALRKFPELAPKRVKFDQLGSPQPKNDFTFTAGNELNELEDKLRTVMSHRGIKDLTDQDVPGAGAFRHCLDGAFHAASRNLRISDEAMMLTARAIYSGIMKSVAAKVYDLDAAQMNRVCRAAIRYQVKANNEHSSVADLDSIMGIDCAAADFWVSSRRVLARAKNPKKFTLGWGKISPVHADPLLPYGSSLEAAGMGMLTMRLNRSGKYVLLTWEEYDHVARFVWSMLVSHACSDDPDSVSCVLETVFWAWGEFGAGAHFACDRIFGLVKEVQLGVGCFLPEKRAKAAKSLSDHARPCPWGEEKSAKSSVSFESRLEALEERFTHHVMAGGMNKDALQGKLTALDELCLYKALPVSSHHMGIGMKEYYEKRVESAAIEAHLDEAVLIAEQILVCGAIHTGKKVPGRILDYDTFRARLPEDTRKAYGIETLTKDTYTDWALEKVAALGEMTDPKQVKLHHTVALDITGMLPLDKSLECMQAHSKSSAIPGPKALSGEVRSNIPTERVYSAWVMENVENWESVRYAALETIEDACVASTAKVEAQKLAPRMTFEMRPGLRLLLSLSENEIQKACQHLAAFVPGKGGVSFAKDMADFTTVSPNEAAAGFSVYYSSDDVDAFSRSFTLQYLERLDKLRAKVHGERIYEELTGFWANQVVVGCDNTGTYTLSGLESDLEGMNGMLNTLMRVASVFSASSRIRERVAGEIEEGLWCGALTIKAYIDDALQRYVLRRDLTAPEVSTFLKIVTEVMATYGITLSIPKLFFGKKFLTFLDRSYASGVLIRGPVKAMARVANAQAKYDLSVPERMAMIGSLFKPMAKQGAAPERVYRCMFAHAYKDVLTMTVNRGTLSDSTAMIFPAAMGGLGLPWKYEYAIEGAGAGLRVMSTIAASRALRARPLTDIEIEDDAFQFADVVNYVMGLPILGRTASEVARAPTSCSFAATKAPSSYTTRLIMTKVSFGNYDGAKHADLIDKFNRAWAVHVKHQTVHAQTIAVAYEAAGLKAMDTALEKLRNSGLYGMVTTRKERFAVQTLHKVDAFKVRAAHESIWGTTGKLKVGKHAMIFPQFEPDDAPEFEAPFA